MLGEVALGPTGLLAVHRRRRRRLALVEGGVALAVTGAALLAQPHGDRIGQLRLALRQGQG